MRTQIAFGLTAALLVNTMPAVSQLRTTNPSQVAIEGGSSTKQPSVIKVEVTPVAWSRKDGRYITKERFTVGERIRFAVSVVLPEAREVFLTSPVRQNRPLLIKGDRLVPYRKSFYLNPECILIRVTELSVPANRPTGIDLFDIADFYDPLEPGEYQLTLSRLLDTCTGEFYQSEPVRFWVIP